MHLELPDGRVVSPAGDTDDTDRRSPWVSWELCEQVDLVRDVLGRTKDERAARRRSRPNQVLVIPVGDCLLPTPRPGTGVVGLPVPAEGSTP